MGWLLSLILLVAPLAAYAVWWRMTGRQPEVRPSVRLLALIGAGIICALAGALVYGFSRGIEPGDRYQPAQIRGGEVVPGRGVAR
jgi:hypothetical protein